MTIREHLKRRGDTLKYVYVAVLLAIYLVTRFAHGSPALGVLMISAFIAATTGFVVLMWRTPCLRCARSLGNAASAANNPFSKRVQRCPHCGVNVDEPMEPINQG